jgi:hypothetical protein
VNVPGACLQVQKFGRNIQNGGVKGRLLCQLIHIFHRQDQKIGRKVRKFGRKVQKVRRNNQKFFRSMQKIGRKVQIIGRKVGGVGL